MLIVYLRVSVITIANFQLESTNKMEQLLKTPHWGLLKKVTFRFFFIFFILFIITMNNGAFQFWGIIMKYPIEWLHEMIPWIGQHILHLSHEITIFTNGSGDTTYNYVIIFVIASVSFITTIVWSVVDRRRRNYEILYYWVTAAVRFYVGLVLINYGLIKVIKLQFPAPGFYRLTETYGNSSPMGLAWTYLGFSKGYNLFMGVAEIASIFLLFRRTMTFGAIITLMTTANVMAVNYFYDVPVKILSTMLVIMTLFLLLNDATRLFRFFFTGEAISLPKIKSPLVTRKWVRLAKSSIKLLLISYALIYGLNEAVNMEKQYGDNAPKPKLYGLYNVDVFIINNDTLPPTKVSPIRWKQLVIDRENYASCQYIIDSTSYFNTTLDTVAKRIDFNHISEKYLQYSFDYNIPSSEKLNFKGIAGSDSVSIYMTRKDLKDFRLMSRGFNWINEYPFNR